MALFQRIADMGRKERLEKERQINDILSDKTKRAKAIAFLKSKEPGFDPTMIVMLIGLLLQYLPQILALFNKKPTK